MPGLQHDGQAVQKSCSFFELDGCQPAIQEILQVGEVLGGEGKSCRNLLIVSITFEGSDVQCDAGNEVTSLPLVARVSDRIANYADFSMCGAAFASAGPGKNLFEDSGRHRKTIMPISVVHTEAPC